MREETITTRCPTIMTAQYRAETGWRYKRIFLSARQCRRVTIEGYNYGAAQTIGLSVAWYVYQGSFVNYSVSSFGSYTPQIYLSNVGGYVVIFISDNPYYPRFTVRAYAQGVAETASYFN